MKKFFESDKIIIRKYLKEDISELFFTVSRSIAELKKWMPWCKSNYSVNDAKNWVESREFEWKNGVEYSFVILNRADSRLIGGVGLNRIDEINLTGNLGYWIGSEFVGKGFATESCKLALKFAFEQLSLNRVEIIMAETNNASKRVAEKLGAVKEGLLREKICVNSKYHNAFIYSILSKDCKS